LSQTPDQRERMQLAKSSFTANTPFPHTAFNYKRKTIKDHLAHLDSLETGLNDLEEEEREIRRKAGLALALPNQPQDWDAILKENEAEPRAVRPLMGDITHLLFEHREIEGTTLAAMHKKRMKERRGPYYSNLTLSAPGKTDADIRKSLPPDMRDIPDASLKVLHRMRMRHVIMTWNTWRSNAHTLAKQRRLITNVLARQMNRTLFGYFSRWKTKWEKQKARRERNFRLRLRLRAVLWQPGLIYAASNGSMRLLSMIQRAPMGVTTPMLKSWRHPSTGKTLLHYACEKGRAQMVAFLLGIGINPRVVDSGGRNCMQVACAGKQTAIVEMLVQKGLDPRVMEEGGSGNIMQLFSHANIMSDQRRVPNTTFKLKKKEDTAPKR